MLGRGWHAAIAVLVCGAMALQIVIAVRVSGTPHDVTAGVLRGSSLPGRIIRVLSFFTIQQPAQRHRVRPAGGPPGP
jgi:hypothetical protein